MADDFHIRSQHKVQVNSRPASFLGPLGVETPFGLFGVLWAFATALHSLETRPLDGVLIYPFVLLLVLNPERLWAIASFSAVHALFIAMRLPSIANHSMFALLVDACLLIGCATVMMQRGLDDRRRALWDAVRGPVKCTLIVVYSFAVFHKLNSSFFDPEVSCAVSQVTKMIGLHGIKNWPADPEIFRLNIYATIVAEIGIAALLAWPPYAFAGALLGLGFHVGLGWARFYDFATVAFALYLFFLPWERIERSLSRLPDWIGTNFIVCAIGVAMSSIIFYGIRGNPIIVRGSNWNLTADTIMCLFWTAAIVPILLPIFWSRYHVSERAHYPGARLAWIIPILALVNGATSYLGLKTVANYSMFSNLRTEGGRSNHFLVPAGYFFIADAQNELVRVESFTRASPRQWPWWASFTGYSNLRWGADMPNARVPFDEVRRLAQSWRALGAPTASIVYERNGQRHDVANVFADSAIMRPMPFVVRKLFAYRAVEADGKESRCRW